MNELIPCRDPVTLLVNGSVVFLHCTLPYGMHDQQGHAAVVSTPYTLMEFTWNDDHDEVGLQTFPNVAHEN
jgi:hypothetical protein